MLFRSVEGVDTSKWYAPAMLWAANRGFLEGMAIDPEGSISREDLARILMRYLAYLDIQYVVTEEYVLFQDDDAISEDAKEAIQIANKLGLLVGKGNRQMDPQGQVTRAELAAILRRLSQLIDAYLVK